MKIEFRAENHGSVFYSVNDGPESEYYYYPGELVRVKTPEEIEDDIEEFRFRFVRRKG